MASRKSLIKNLKLDPATKPIRATIKLQNNCLRARRIALGLTTTEIAERVGISYSDYLRMENMKASPLSVREGEPWKKAAVNLARFYHVLPENLFPSVVLAVDKPVAEREFDESEIQALLPDYMRRESLGPEEIMSQNQLRGTVTKALKRLKPIEVEVIKRHYGLDTGEGQKFSHIAEEIGLSRERINNIHEEAIGKLGKAVLRNMQLPVLAPNDLGVGVTCIRHNLGKIALRPDPDLPFTMNVMLYLPEVSANTGFESLQFQGKSVLALVQAADSSSLSTHARLLKISIVDRDGNVVMQREGRAGTWAIPPVSSSSRG